MDSLAGRAAAWVLDILTRMGYPGLAALVLLENLFPPLPSEVILPLAGYLALDGRLSLPGVVAAATAGSVAGAWVLYLLGAELGEDRLRALVRRFGRYAGIAEADLEAALRWMRRYGRAAVFLGRLVPIVRSLISLPAGLGAMPLLPFTLLTAAGAALWNALLAGLGYGAGAAWLRVAAWVKAYERAVLVLLVAGAVGWWLRRRRR